MGDCAKGRRICTYMCVSVCDSIRSVFVSVSYELCAWLGGTVGDLLTAVDYDIAIDFWKPTTIEASLAHKRAAEAIGEFAMMLEQLSNGLRSGLKNFVDFDNREFDTRFTEFDYLAIFFDGDSFL